MKRTLTLLLTLALTGSAFAGGAAGGVSAKALTLKLADTTAKAELLLPANASKAPLVLLIQGTGPEDMNGSFITYTGVQQGSLGKLAGSLANQGFAVMRFDKRYAAQTFDAKTAQAAQASYEKLTMQDLLADARTALNTAKAQAGVEASKIFLYGWSEGSVVAANLALETGAQGLIVQGPVVDGFAATFANQFRTVGLSYLTPYSEGGKMDLPAVLKALYGPGSGLAKMQASLLLSQDSTPQQPKLAGVLDSNKDGAIDLRNELLPRVEGFYQALTAQSPMYAPAGTLPTLGELAPKLKLPVLILQGEHDGNIDPAYARKLSTLLPQGTLKLYPGLGHSLGEAASITQDNFAPMETAPMNDLAQWLKNRL